MFTHPRMAREALGPVALIALATATGCTSSSEDAPPPASLRPTATATKPLAAMSAREILAVTERALNGARSVHVKGSTSDRGDVVTIDLRLTRQGARGVLRGQIAGKPTPLQMIATQRVLYLRGRQFWLASAGAATAKRLGDRWVAVPRNGAPAQSFVSMQAFSRHVFAESGTTRQIGIGKPTKIAGRSVIALIDTTDRSALYVAATGTPYPLRIVEPGGKHHVDLTGYNARVTVVKPKKAITY